jgi:hypothetical protein
LRSDHDWRNLQAMERRDLILIFFIIEITKPWPQVRDEVTLHPAGGSPIRMILDEIDIGNRSLNILLALYEHKNKARFLKTQKAKLACGVYNASGPLMLTIRDPGGFALEDPRREIVPNTLGPSTFVQDSGAGSSTLAQETAVSVRADAREVESIHSSDPGDLPRESRKEAKRVEREAWLAQLDNKDASFNEMAAVAKKELADDQAAEEHLRAELGMVGPVDADPDFKGDQMTSSAMADMVGGRLQHLSLWNQISMDHINVNTEW